MMMFYFKMYSAMPEKAGWKRSTHRSRGRFFKKMMGSVTKKQKFRLTDVRLWFAF
jgi:hypothetical protein